MGSEGKGGGHCKRGVREEKGSMPKKEEQGGSSEVLIRKQREGKGGNKENASLM